MSDEQTEPPQAPAGSPASERGSANDPEAGMASARPPPSNSGNSHSPKANPAGQQQPNMKQLLETVNSSDLPSYEDVTGGHNSDETLRMTPISAASGTGNGGHPTCVQLKNHGTTDVELVGKSKQVCLHFKT